jgi:hypothetical protein
MSNACDIPVKALDIGNIKGGRCSIPLRPVRWNSSVVPASCQVLPSGNPSACVVRWGAPSEASSWRLGARASGDDSKVDAVLVENNTVQAGVLVVPCYLSTQLISVLQFGDPTESVSFLLTCPAVCPYQWPHVHMSGGGSTKSSPDSCGQGVGAGEDLGRVQNTRVVNTQMNPLGLFMDLWQLTFHILSAVQGGYPGTVARPRSLPVSKEETRSAS